MTNKTVLILALVGAGLPALGAQAASVSQDEADRLKALFERYVGHPAPGEPGSVTVVPEGSGYRANLDVKQLTRALESFGVSVEPATSSLMLTPNDNGTWRVTGDTFPPLVMHYNGQTLALRSSTFRFEGTFDPKIPAFADGSGAEDGTTFDQEAPLLTQHRRIGHIAVTQKAAAGENGSASLETHYGLSDLTDNVTIRAEAPKATVEVAPTPPPTEFSYTAPSGTADLHLDAVRLKNLLDIWAFFVAHPTRDSITASQDELRGLLRSALPVLGGLKQSGAIDGFSLVTQLGPFSARKLAGSLDLSDLAAAGKAALGLTLDGLSVPSTDLPPWSVGLIPTVVDLKPTVVGFHFDDAAKEAVEDFDLKQDGFTPAQREKIAHIAWPGDGGRVTLAPSRITSGLLDLRLDGEATIRTVPTGRLTVTGSGIDTAISTLQSAAGTDETAAQMLAQFVAAKNLAKPNPDGSFTWIIEATSPGPLTVNGVPLK